MEKKNQEDLIVENPTPQEVLQCEINTSYERQTMKKAYILYSQKSITLWLITMGLFLLLFVSLITIPSWSQYAFIPLLLEIFPIVFLIKIFQSIRLSINRLMETFEGGSLHFEFYETYFSLTTNTKTMNSNYHVDYKSIASLKKDKQAIYLLFENKLTVIPFKDMGVNTSKILKLLEPVKTPKQIKEQKQKRTATILLLVSLSSIFLGLILSRLISAVFYIDQFPYSMSEAMWICFVLLPVPMASIIYGIYCKKQGLKTNQNIVFGIVILFFLSLYGCYSIEVSKRISHDFSYVEKTSDTLQIDLPTKGKIEVYLFHTQTSTIFVDSYAYVKLNKDGLAKMNQLIEDENSPWLTTTGLEETSGDSWTIPNFLNVDYFLLYDVGANKFIESREEEGDFIYVGFDDQSKMMYILQYHEII